jgi:hypothetical protein
VDTLGRNDVFYGPLEFMIFDAECLENGRAAEDCRRNFSGVLVVFESFHFMWALLMEVVSVF